MSECLFNNSVEMDINELPQTLREMCLKLEAYDKANDWLHYATDCDVLDMVSKRYFANGEITHSQFEKIKTRYCGYI